MNRPGFHLNEMVAINLSSRPDRVMGRILAFSGDHQKAFVEIRADVDIQCLHALEVTPPLPIYCAFCGKTDKEVRFMVAGPDAYICDECVPICVEIIDERGQEEKKVKPRKKRSKLSKT